MSTDRELLELAAKAIGLKPHVSQSAMPGILMDDQTFWSPLDDDGDALRLAVKLSISLDVNGMFVHADTRHCAKDIGYFEENSARHNGCIATATRRAIVRAAAAIGESMP